MSGALLTDSLLPQGTFQDARTDLMGHLGPLLTLITTLAISIRATWCLWHQPHRQPAYLLSLSHVLINLTNTITVLLCITTNTFQLVLSLEPKYVVSELSWVCESTISD